MMGTKARIFAPIAVVSLYFSSLCSQTNGNTHPICETLQGPQVV